MHVRRRGWSAGERWPGSRTVRAVTAEPTLAAIVLAGGAARRMAGTDKLLAELPDGTVLDRALTAVAALPTVVVGPPRTVARPVTWTREEPPGTGPVAAIAAGLAALPVPAHAVVVLAADQPGVTPATITRLHAALTADPDTDGVVLVDPDGRAQWLTGIWRRAALTAALPADPADAAMRKVLGGLRVRRIPAVADEAHDVDTPADLAWWRERLDS